MSIQEALELIKTTNVCYSCKYRGSGCERKEEHVWTDGYCREYNEAVQIIEEKLSLENTIEQEPESNTESDSESEPELEPQTEPNGD